MPAPTTEHMQFINDAKEQIEKKAQKPKKIHFCFAIMEMEAWFLGFSDLFIKIDARLTNTFIKEKLDFDLDNIDPETDPEFFHPAKKLNDIYELIGKKYEKPESAKPILGHLEKFDFEYFYEIDKCNSFKIFHKTLIISNL